ncbi:IS110 family transposase [Actinomycetospora corticicola]
MVLMVGVDVHKDTHTAVVVDQLGVRRAQRRVQATDAGHLELLAWVQGVGEEFAVAAGPEIEWAVEDCRHVSLRLERALLAAGQRVRRVPPKLMAGARSSAREFGKSDPIDATAIARAALREPDLPLAEHTPASRELKLLVDHREHLVAERTAMICRLRWHLHELDPGLERSIPARGLDKPTRLTALAALLPAEHPGLVGELAAELVADIAARTTRIRALEREIARRVAVLAPQLLELPGCGPLSAAKLLAETARPGRFRSEACFAMHAGVAPIPASSGRTDRHRLARGGNRQLNAALHRIALTQTRLPESLGRAYYDKRRARGDRHNDALRALKRRLARVVFNLLRQTEPTPTPAAA